ncbi:type VI secretion system membrane subunit TssM [Nitrococcus mobilis]|uniref:type VI secretion system membrane subunit TssM n=1 Tax=Nitrococcus mobilis TaxID=35797 RepID=UPI000307D11A|nr:type VI secretion system membrane subunit TssM [Nitrococcus mobilis]
MRRVLAVFRQAWLLSVIGLIVLSLLIWFFGPYLAFAELRPLAGVVGRSVAIVLVFAIWGSFTLLRYRRARRASASLRAELVGQADFDMDAAAEELRRRFEEAIAFLRRSKGAGDLYRLPWYVIIGPPGSGKTTALVNSGLNFPLAQKLGKEALRGVGGTRNCDWWFTDEAVLLDTAGRYVTQDTEPSADNAEWSQFLQLLARYRKRRPINGVLVTLSATDLLLLSPDGRKAHVLAVRRRLDELQRQLRIRFPVYFVVTKCDLVAGFVEFFDDLDYEGRAQVWGITFPEPGRSAAPVSDLFAVEYDGLVTRLNERVLSRLDQEREAQRRTVLFGFPQRMASLKGTLSEFIGETFEASGFDRPVMLRGVYFTSGTQEGIPIDRMMGTLANTFGIDAAMAVPASRGQGRSYFLQRLLKSVIFPESGLAGVNWRLEVGRAIVQNVSYIAVLGLAALLVAGWFTSYRYNRDYLDDVRQTLKVHKEQASRPVPRKAGSEDVLLRLDALSEVAAEANRYRDELPLLMGLGLYRGDTVGESALDAYHQGLHALLLPRVVLNLKERIRGSTRSPKRLYGYLKAYLMLADPAHMNEQELGAIVRTDLMQLFDDSPALGEALAAHFESLLGQDEPVHIAQVDQQLVAQARAALKQASIPGLMLAVLKTRYGVDHPKALRLDLKAGLGSEQIFRRAGGVPWSDPVPALYTHGGFEEITGGVDEQLVTGFLSDDWVLGGGGLPSGPTARFRLAADFLREYEQEYIAYWDSLLKDLEIVPLVSVQQAKAVLSTISGPTSPLKQLLQTIDAQTHFPEPQPKKAEQGGRFSRLLGMAEQARASVARPRPGKRISQHFQSLHRLVAVGDGGAPPIDQIIGVLGELYTQLDAMGSGVGNKDPLVILSRSGGQDALRRLRMEAQRQPEPLGRLLSQLAGKGQQMALHSLRSELNQAYRNNVLPECRELVEERYPFDESSSVDIPLSDFGRLFGPSGVFETFFTEHLAPLVDTSRQRWRWRNGVRLGMPDSVLVQFRRAREIRNVFFAAGKEAPSLGFSLTPQYLDARVRRFTLNVDGASLVYRHGPPRPLRVQWPGEKEGRVIAEFEDRSGHRPSALFEGPWAWFRALQSASVSRQSDVSYLAMFAAGGYDARLRVEFESMRNPLRFRDWARFHCPGSL